MGNGAGRGNERADARSQGVPALSASGRPGEVLERLLGYAVREKELKDISVGLMKRFKGLRGVLDASHEDLKGSGLVGDSGAVFLKFVKEAAAVYLKERMMCSGAAPDMRAVLDYLNLTLSGERIEKFLAIYLGPGKEVLSVDVLHEGTINQTVVYPRKAIEKAFRHKASGVIFVHNHPSGDATPSAMDRQLARTLDSAAAAVDLEVVDHIVIGKNRHFSARENGWMSGGAFRRA